jgi:hypothetical protein
MDQKQELSMIAKNSGLSIGLVLTVSVFIFFGGRSLGKMEAELEAHKELNRVQFGAIAEDVREIKATQVVILKAVTVDDKK